MNLGWKGFTIRPFDTFDYVVQREGSFKESGAGPYDLSVRKTHATLLRNELGLNFAGCLCTERSKWTFAPKVSWVREVRTGGEVYTAEFKGTGVPFAITGYVPDRSLLATGALLTGNMLKDRLTLSLYYNGEFAHKYSNNSYGGQIRLGF